MSSYPDNLNQFPSAPYKEYCRWTDYFELLCLANPDGEFTQRDLEPLIKSNNDLNPIKENENDGTYNKQKSTKWDNWENRIYDIFQILNYRSQSMGSFYPFQLHNDTQLVLKQELTDKNIFYLYLLFSSNLAYFSPEHRSIFTKTFESISQEAIRRILPGCAEVHIFGTSRTTKYAGRLYDRLCQLSRDVRAEIICKEDSFTGVNAGDAGLDIVAWVPIGDIAPGIPVCFSQCACTVEWKDKQFSITPDKWRNRLKFVTPYLPITVIPFSYRKADGLWENEDSISQTLLIDRDRIILLLADNYDFFTGSETFRITATIANQKMSI